MPICQSKFIGDLNLALMEGANILENPSLVDLKLLLGNASDRTGLFTDAHSFNQVLLSPLDFANELNSEVRGVYLAKWKDAQQALKEDH
ncbi:hypothetical protein [Bythopirellula polymerisocia]|uniref:Uncharacterized protein n=1 Tax=Bythopirellula polymerisocia TaxID=2528003 RepID=A0A5C6CCZ7_9BACT|nr:hypothetical protein [Bythopirellula polymerisocia]TWU21246.1 hypothetical protein Pla144_46550 [Bythopirellula polymerisocia]